MTDMTSSGMARFYRRYDLRHRLLVAAALCASLVLSAVNLLHGGMGGRAAALLWAFGLAFPPLAIGAWWGAQEYIVRWRERRPPMSADDLPNGVRIANAGFLFSVALVACVLGSQTVVTLTVFGYAVGPGIPRLAGAAFGVALICLGNVWPRLPTPRAQPGKAAAEMKINRVWGWIMVILGLGMILGSLLLPALRALQAHG